MTEILYLAWNRLEFTRKSYETMLANTDWSRVDRLVVYDDGSTDGTAEYLREQVSLAPIPTRYSWSRNLGPVGIMRHYLVDDDPGLFIKIDNDVMLPPGWLPECLQVMQDHPELDLLGIEAIRPVGVGPRSFRATDHIGGIGLMRYGAFECCLPTPADQGSRYGFTEWQWRHDGSASGGFHANVKKGWLDPALPVGLLNLVPVEPWRSLSLEYIRKGWQRDWPAPWEADDARRWEWFA